MPQSAFIHMCVRSFMLNDPSCTDRRFRSAASIVARFWLAAQAKTDESTKPQRPSAWLRAG